MKALRNYRFVLTNIPNSILETGEIRIGNEEVTGERINLTRMQKDERNELLKRFNIPN